MGSGGTYEQLAVNDGIIIDQLYQAENKAYLQKIIGNHNA